MILFRSLFVQLLAPYFMGVAILTFVLSMDTIYRLISLIVTKGMDVTSVGLLLFYRLPQFLSVTLPLGMVIASFIVMIRLSMDLEIAAMRAAGIGFWTISRPFLAFALGLTSVTWIITLWAQPTGFKAFEAEQFRLLKSQTSKNIQPKILNYDFDGKVLYVQEKDEQERLTGVFISDNELQKDSMVILAEQGIIQVQEDEQNQELVLRLFDGKIHMTETAPAMYRTIQFQTFDYIFQVPDIVSSTKQHIWGSSTAELIREGRHKHWTELMLRITTPLACIGFALVSVVWGLADPRSGRSGPYLRALILVVLYYVLWLGFKELVFNLEWTPQLLWFPPVIIAGLGLYSIYKVDNNLENFLEVLHYALFKSD